MTFTLGNIANNNKKLFIMLSLDKCCAEHKIILNCYHLKRFAVFLMEKYYELYTNFIRGWVIS